MLDIKWHHSALLDYCLELYTFPSVLQQHEQNELEICIQCESIIISATIMTELYVQSFLLSLITKTLQLSNAVISLDK